MGGKWLRRLAGLMMVLGLTVLMYPWVSDLVNRCHGSYAIQSLRETMDTLDSGQLDRHLAAAKGYNAMLRQAMGEPTGEPLRMEYDEILDFGNGIMGYIRIPKIGVELPVYHGVDAQTLEKGIGHMPASAFPVGGVGNHAVLTGHTGHPGAKLFTDLTQLQEGDGFSVIIGEHTSHYLVDQIRVVLPEETEGLMAAPGKDYCTLVTCTPYGVNSHRLLVRGSRVEAATVLPPEEPRENGENRAIPLWLGTIPALAAAIWMAAGNRRKRNVQKNPGIDSAAHTDPADTGAGSPDGKHPCDPEKR